MGKLSVLLIGALALVACRPVSDTDWNYRFDDGYRQVSNLVLYEANHTYVLNSTLTSDLMGAAASEHFELTLDLYLNDGGAALASEFDTAALPTSGGGGFGGDGFQSDYPTYLDTRMRDTLTFWATQRADSYEQGECFQFTFTVVGLFPGVLEDAFATGGFTSILTQGSRCAPGQGLAPQL